MKTLNDNIKKGEYQKVYLIYGEEEYLKKQYKDRMKQAIIGDDTINYSYFEGDNTKPEDVITICETIPFFSERRLVIVSDSGYFKTANDKMADYIKELPDYLILIFIEKDVDKRNKVYKAVSSNGYVCEMQYQTPATLKRWIAGMMASNDYKISEAACELLLDKTGASMELIRNEIDKLISYCSDKKMVMPQDVEAVCSTQTVSHIFDMLEAVANKNKEKALSLYYDLLTLKEPPMRILYLIVRQFNGILQAKELAARGLSSKEIASAIKVAPFVAGKYLSQAKYFTTDTVKDILNECADIEELFRLLGGTIGRSLQKASPGKNRSAPTSHRSARRSYSAPFSSRAQNPRMVQKCCNLPACCMPAADPRNPASFPRSAPPLPYALLLLQHPETAAYTDKASSPASAPVPSALSGQNNPFRNVLPLWKAPTT